MGWSAAAKQASVFCCPLYDSSLSALVMTCLCISCWRIDVGSPRQSQVVPLVHLGPSWSILVRFLAIARNCPKLLCGSFQLSASFTDPAWFARRSHVLQLVTTQHYHPVQCSGMCLYEVQDSKVFWYFVFFDPIEHALALQHYNLGVSKQI